MGAPPAGLESSDVRWIFHPTREAEAAARLSLGGGRTLFVGAGGERWVTQAEHVSYAAPAAAPEALIEVGKLGASYGFVGASGRVYIAAEPLGAFTSVRAPPREFISLSASGSRLAGIERDGTLWAGADWGQRWERAQTPGGRAAEVALNESGQGLALVVPERWWITDDGGRRWRASDLPPLGARRLGRAPDGQLIVDGLFRRVRLEGERWTSAPARPEGADKPGADLGPAPDARRIEEQTGVLDGDEYFALERRGQGTERRWVALSGKLGARLSEQEAEELTGATCGDLLLAKRGQRVAVVCGPHPPSQASAPLSLWTSDDGGASFRRRKAALRGVWGELELAVGSDGSLLLSGVCPPHLTAPGCAPRGAYRIDPKAAQLEPLALPGLSRPEALAWGSSGRAYVVGRREKDGRLVLYVSSDEGRSFRIRDLELGESTDERRSGRESVQVHLNVDDAGVVAISVRGEDWMLVTADEAGHLMSRGRAPSSATALSLAGLRGLALDPTNQRLWESVDGGSTWQAVPLPRALCGIAAPKHSSSRVGADGSCGVAVACSSAGCVLGSSLTRLGWGAQEPGAEVVASAAAKRTAVDGRHRTPIACFLGSEPWQHLEGVQMAPGAPDAAIRETHWFAAADDPETGAVWTYHASAGRRAFERHELFGAVSEPTRYALAILPQVEGSVALRYRVPRSSRHERDVTGVEVAWDNRFEEVIGKARIDGSFRPLPGDYRTRAPRTLQAEPALLSIAGRGVFVRLHPSLDDRQTTFYVEEQGVQRLPPMAWPPSREAKRTEMVRVDGRSMALGIYGDGQWLAWAYLGAASGRSPSEADGTLGAWTIALPGAATAGLLQRVSIAYVGIRPGIAVVETTPTGEWWRAYTVPLRGEDPPFGEAHEVALQAHLTDPPAPCDAATRQSSARLVAPAHPARSHPVWISDPADPPRLLWTRRAVLHGSPDAPCVAAFEASSGTKTRGQASPPGASGADPAERTFAVLPAADLSYAWLFREVTESRWLRRIYARSMSCRYDPALAIPADLVQSLAE